MKIRKFNEEIENISRENGRNSGQTFKEQHGHADPMEICTKCGAHAVHIMDNSSLYHPDSFEPRGMNFDDEMYAETYCDNCKNIENIMGIIDWRPTTTQIEYSKMISKGINPINVKKYKI